MVIFSLPILLFVNDNNLSAFGPFNDTEGILDKLFLSRYSS